MPVQLPNRVLPAALLRAKIGVVVGLVTLKIGVRPETDVTVPDPPPPPKEHCEKGGPPVLVHIGTKPGGVAVGSPRKTLEEAVSGWKVLPPSEDSMIVRSGGVDCALPIAAAPNITNPQRIFFIVFTYGWQL